MHVFVGPLFRVAPAPPVRSIHAAHLLSDSLADLKRFAHLLELSPARLRWSNAGVPHFIIGPFVRDIAIRQGAIAVSRPHLASLVSLWRARQRQSLKRLQASPEGKSRKQKVEGRNGELTAKAGMGEAGETRDELR